MAKPKKNALKKISDSNSTKDKTPVSKADNCKFRALAQWWHDFNNENITILPGKFPKIHYASKTRKRSFDDTGYKLIVRPQFQIFNQQHTDDAMNSPKKKEQQAKKTIKNQPVYNMNHNEHLDFFHHQNTVAEQLKQYREGNAYSRARMRKVNRKQLHKAAMMIFRVRQDADVKKAPTTSATTATTITTTTVKEETSKKENLIKNKAKPAKKLVQKSPKPRLLKTATVKKDIKPIDGFGAPIDEKREVVKPESAPKTETELTHSEINQLNTVLSTSSKASVSSLVSSPPKATRNDSSATRLVNKEKKSSAKICEINQCIVNFPEEKCSNELKYTTFGLMPSKSSIQKRIKSLSKRSLEVKNKISRSAINFDKNCFENDNFLIVRSLQDNIPFMEGDGLKINANELLEKHGFPKVEPQYKYSQKYPVRVHSKVALSRSKLNIPSEDKCKRPRKIIRHKPEIDKTEALLKETEARLNMLDRRREKLLVKIEEHATKGKNNRAFNEYLTEKSVKLNKEIDQISKRINVKTNGLDLSLLMDKIIRKYS